MKVAIIGAGASGLALASFLSQKEDYFDIYLYEKNAVIGKKLAATGNGHGNLSNQNMTISHYYGLDEHTFKMVEDFKIEQLTNPLGILLRTKNELYYPFSESAKTVCDAFNRLLNQHEISLHLNSEIISIQKKSQGYLINTHTQEKQYVDVIVLCCGGHAGQNFGADGKSFQLLDKLNIQYTHLKPVLVPFETKNPIKSLKGCRFHGTFSLQYNSKVIKSFKGEALITEYGLSGISIMQLSRYYDENKKGKWEISCNLVDELDKSTLKEYYDHHLEDMNLYDGIIQPKLSKYFNELKTSNFDDFYNYLSSFTFEISKTKSYDFAQVTRGGVLMDQLDDNLMVQNCPGLYICGEMLNVDGDCGGYNLHFAFACAKQVSKALINQVEGVGL